MLNDPSKKTYTGFFLISALTLAKLLDGDGVVKSGWDLFSEYALLISINIINKTTTI